MNRPQNLPTAIANPIPIPVDFILHDEAHPFCDDATCDCHDEEQEDNKALFLESIEQPIQDGLLTEHEGYCLHWGEIV